LKKMHDVYPKSFKTARTRALVHNDDRICVQEWSRQLQENTNDKYVRLLFIRINFQKSGKNFSEDFEIFLSIVRKLQEKQGSAVIVLEDLDLFASVPLRQTRNYNSVLTNQYSSIIRIV
jgi:hypothetical protein